MNLTRQRKRQFVFIASAATIFYLMHLTVHRSQYPSRDPSFCSTSSAARGPGQKVLAYSYYEGGTTSRNEGRDYLSGVARNLPYMRALYHGYVMRVYHDLAEDSPSLAILRKLAEDGGDLDLCQVDKIPALGDMSPVFPMVWRFLVGLDPLVDVFFVRDLDSIISEREEAAVAEFLKFEGTDWHVMRDHPQHCIGILGGSWGVKLENSKTRQLFTESFYKSLNETALAYAARTAYQPDQQILTKYFWPWAKDTLMAHDSYCCKGFSAGWRPYSTERSKEAPNFVGAASLGAMLQDECPKECRPENHKDWVFC